MKRKLLRASIVALILLLVLAVPILASYSSTITVTESAGNSYVNLPIIDSMGISSMVTSGFISSTGLDTRVKYGNTELPHMLADDKLLFVSDITANTSKQFTFSTGNTAQSDYPIIVGVGGYVTTPDNADLELGDNFELEISLNIADTSYTVFNKLNALRLDYNATTNNLTLTCGNYSSPDYTLTATGIEPGLHTVKIETEYSGGTGGDIVLYPAGPGDYENIPQEDPDGAPHWQILQDDSTGAVWFNDTEYADLYVFDDGSSFSFDSLSIWYCLEANYPFSKYFPLIKMAGETLYKGGVLDPYPADNAWRETKYMVNPVTGVAWQSSDLVDIQFGISCDYYSGVIGLLAMKIILNDASGYPVLNLYVDDFLTVADTEDLLTAIPDNANNWVWYPNPYINYIKLSTGN